MISSLVALSRLPVGSSASRMLGLLTSARAIATRWRWPPDSSLGRCFIRSSSPTSHQCVGGQLPPLLGPHAGIHQRQLDIVQAGGPGKQVEGLEHEADLLVADPGQLVVLQLGDPVAVEPVLPGRGAVQAADQVHQGGLARARGPHDGHELVLPDGEVHPADARTTSPPMSYSRWRLRVTITASRGTSGGSMAIRSSVFSRVLVKGSVRSALRSALWRGDSRNGHSPRPPPPG